MGTMAGLNDVARPPAVPGGVPRLPALSLSKAAWAMTVRSLLAKAAAALAGTCPGYGLNAKQEFSERLAI